MVLSNRFTSTFLAKVSSVDTHLLASSNSEDKTETVVFLTNQSWSSDGPGSPSS